MRVIDEERLNKVLGCIREHQKNGKAPNYRQIQKECRIASLSTVYLYVNELKKRKLIETETQGGWKQIRTPSYFRPSESHNTLVVGAVHCGPPSDAIENIEACVSLPSYRKKYPRLIKVFDNPKKIVPFAMNIGIKNSKGKYIIRLDAHAEYANDYFSKCVHYLDNIEVDNVGGTMETRARTRMGLNIAKMLSSKFGVGNSQFRTDGKSGYVDTVPFGAFKREVFSKYGGYDERLVRNQDNELNYRIRKNGGRIFLARLGPGYNI